MLSFFRDTRRRWPLWLLLGALALATAGVILFTAGGAAAASHSADADGEADGQRVRGFIVPFADSARGRQLFVGKGCVICHAINGVGGKAAPPLDADPDVQHADIFDFAARMWRGAPTMFVLQEMELGYQIDMTGEELAHIAGFVYDLEEQKRFSDDDVPELIRDWMTDTTYERLDELREELREYIE